MSMNQKRGRTTFRRRLTFVSGSLFVSPCPPECYFENETKIEPDLRLLGTLSSEDEFVDDDERRRVWSGSRTSSKAGKTNV